MFSGTGNTLKAADAVASALQKYGVSTSIVPVDLSVQASACDANRFDLALFAYPIHAFNTPRFFLRFVKGLPELNSEKKGMPAYVFKTSGEPFRPNRASSFALFRILKKKGFQPRLDLHMLMPYNIMFRYPDAMAKQMYLHTTGPMAACVAERAASNAECPVRFNPLRIMASYLLRLQWFGAWINGPMIHVDKKRCSRCGLCAKRCPARNITLKEFPSFGWKCTMCMRCVMNCPENAVKPGFLTLWKVNPAWDFPRLTSDKKIPENWTDSDNPGYFKLFRNYYRQNPP